MPKKEATPAERARFVFNRSNTQLAFGIAAKTYRKTALVEAFPLATGAWIDTLEGELWAPAGAYVCRGVTGELWAVQKDVFEASYVEVKGA